VRVCRRICALQKRSFVAMEASRPWCLADNSTPSQVCRTSRNTEANDGFFGQGCIYLSDAVYDKSFTRKNGENSYYRVWKLLELCYKLLGLGKDVTQRELFYMLLTDAAAKVESQAQVNESIQDVVALLRCDRRSLGILASSKGSVVGRLVIEVLWILMLWKAMNELEPTAKELSNSCF
jgi:DNA topoisomerase VI subunit A